MGQLEQQQGTEVAALWMWVASAPRTVLPDELVQAEAVERPGREMAEVLGHAAEERGQRLLRGLGGLWVLRVHVEGHERLERR